MDGIRFLIFLQGEDHEGDFQDGGTGCADVSGRRTIYPLYVRVLLEREF